MKTEEVLAMPEPFFIDELRTDGPAVQRKHRCSRRGPARWSLTPHAFETLLRGLSPDREEAGRKYEDMRRKIVRFFARRGCNKPEELFDRTVDRACRKIDLGTREFSGDVLAFCYAVGRFVLREYYWREVKLAPLPEDVPFPDIRGHEKSEREFEMLEACLNRLSQSDRDLITAYYQGEGGERIRRRKELAGAVGGLNALRIKVFRIRARLREWFYDCEQDQKTVQEQRLSSRERGSGMDDCT